MPTSQGSKHICYGGRHFFWVRLLPCFSGHFSYFSHWSVFNAVLILPNYYYFSCNLQKYAGSLRKLKAFIPSCCHGQNPWWSLMRMGCIGTNQGAPAWNRDWTVNEHLWIYLPKPVISGLKKNDKKSYLHEFIHFYPPAGQQPTKKKIREMIREKHIWCWWFQKKKNIIFSNHCERSTNLYHLLA